MQDVARTFEVDRESVLQAARLGEFPHHALLLLGELFRHGDGDLDDEITPFLPLRNALPPYPESLSRRRSMRDAYGDLAVIEGLDADLRSERRLGDVQRDRRDHVEPFAPEEAIGLHLKGDQQVAGRSALRAPAALILQADLRPCIHSRGDGNVDLAARGDLPG